MYSQCQIYSLVGFFVKIKNKKKKISKWSKQGILKNKSKTNI